MGLTSERARELGRKSGEARRQTATGKRGHPQPLTLDRVERELGRLETVEDAMRRLDRLNTWIAAGLLSGSQGGAAVRAVEVWLRGHESRLTERVVEELHDEVERLKGAIGEKSVRLAR